MWGSSSNYPSIRSYANAKRVYEETKPLRGKPHFRPLDSRSSRAKSQILKDGEDYIIRLYQTDIIRYKPDGRVILNHGGYVTVTTAGAISAMSPFTSWCRKGYLVVTTAYNRWYSGNHHRFVVPREGLEFDARGVPKDPPAAIVRKTRVRKDAAKKVRAYFKQVPKMIEAYAKAFEGGAAPKSVAAMPLKMVNPDTPLDEETASKIAMLYMGRDYDWNTQSWTYSGSGYARVFWNHVYKENDIVENYEIQLPYGVVP